MRVPYVGFIGDAYSAITRSIDMQECVNLYLEREKGSSKSPAVLINTPGLDLHVDTGIAAAWRGLHVTADNNVFGVVGNQVVQIFPDKKQRSIGTIKTISGVVDICDNGPRNMFGGAQILFVDGRYSYVYDLKTSEFYPLSSDSNMPIANHLVYKDGYFICNRVGTGEFWISNLYDGNTWYGTAFATAESMPDNIVSMKVVNNELWLFGSKSTEIWYNAGNNADGVPQFQRILNAFIETGTVAEWSPATLGNQILWLGSDNTGNGTVWQANGYQPTRVSTHGIEHLISGFHRVDDAIGFCYQQEGHAFYVLTFPTAQKTLCYDMSSGCWHERSSYNMDKNVDEQWRVSCHGFCNGNHFVGDAANGKIYILNLSTYTENGGLIRRIRTTPHVSKSMERVFYYEFELDMQKGCGIPKGYGSDPQAMLKLSRDGGHTWGFERSEAIGKQGQYLTRMHWHQLGSGRDMVFQVVVTDPIPVRLIAAWLDVEGEK